MRAGWARRFVERLLRKGKIVKTTSLSGFLFLYALTKLKPLRRRSLRFAGEQAALAAWLDLVAETAASNYVLALEVARMRSLVKGYGETLERGRAKLDKLAAALPRLRDRDNAGHLLGDLIKAALADEDSQALDKAIAELRNCASAESRV
jgi:indolepyruvate ferredoxin oxidoreductase beta subunit